MFYTTGELPMSGAQKTALLQFCALGPGFLGVQFGHGHIYTWPDYLDRSAATLMVIPWHQAVTIEVVDPGDPVVAFSRNFCKSSDEIYK